ncbi:endolytic transglycosylase MltG [Sphingomonas sp. SUN039]|uniref:endolytic transglycosylase MltG n=1 Tax=Sphingomonas sp. SUN039 TaxID=2937787 RepID=UPI002164CEC8|nr:endolytic transglycosylase MltG [Sphingomonas sp. SUN039]UVO52938.1 endolytic transglycosylase MltG [Sphingomonas sp. SUN039]
MRRILLLVAVVALVVFAVSRCTGGRAPRDVEVVIPQGSSLTAAATALEKAGAVDSADAFLTNAKIFGSGDPIKPGEYKIKRGMDASAILALLQSGKVLQRFVVIPEGLPSILVYERLYATPLLTGEIAMPPEGSVLPDNYAYVRGESRKGVLARMQKAMQTALANAWAARKPSTAVTTPEAAIILASIIEKETARASERRLVAAVYSNRLKRGMPLQADPTTIYPVTKGKALGRRILRSELDSDNPYNTYRHNGLPPGPIANPGKAAIQAALDPAPSNALYFVAQGDGSSAFADTLEQHNANVQKWYAHRRAKGEM